MTPELIQRAIDSLSWLVTDAEWRSDDTKGNLDEGSQGGYSPELTEARNVLEELKNGAV